MNHLVRSSILYALVLFTSFATGVSAGPSHGKSAGGNHSARSSASSSVNRGTSSNVNKSTNVNTNKNVNVNSNKNVNVNVDNNRGYSGGYNSGCCYHPVATAAAVTATAVVTAAVVGSMVNTLPPSCSTVIMNGIAYQQCGSTWYQPQFSNGNTTYVVINAPG
jgi:Family of unknown function (DUF6515)